MSMDTSTLGISVKSDGIKEASTSLSGLTTSARNAEKRVSALEQAMAKLDATSKSATGQAQAYNQKLQEHINTLGSLASGVNKTTSATTSAKDSMAKLQAEANRMNKEWDKGIALNQAGARAMELAATRARELTVATRGNSEAMREAHALARGLSGSLGALWVTYGNLAGMAVGLAIGTSLKEIVSVGKSVEATLEGLRVKGQETIESVSEIREAVISLGKGIYGPKEVAKAFETMILAGLNAKQALAGIRDALNLATVGGTTIEKSAYTLVQVGTALGYSAESYSRIADVISMTAAVSMSSVESLSEAFKSGSVVGKLYGVTLVDIGTSLAALSNLGIQGSAAGTSLKNFYKELASSSEKVKNTLKDMKLVPEDFKDAEGNYKSLLEVVATLDKGLNNLTLSEQKKAIANLSNERGMKTAIELLDLYRNKVDEATEAGVNHTNMADMLRKKIEESYGFAAISAAQMSLTVEGRFKSVANTLQTVFLEAFQKVSPELSVVAYNMQQAFTRPEFLSGMVTLAEGAGKLAVAIAENIPLVVKLVEAFLAAKAIMFVVDLFVSLRTAFLAASVGAAALGVSLGPIAAALLAAGAAYAYFTKEKNNAADSKAYENAINYSKDYAKALDSEAERLTRQIDLMKQGKNAMMASTEAIYEQNLALAKTQGDKAKRDAQERVWSATSKVSAVDREISDSIVKRGGLPTAAIKELDASVASLKRIEKEVDSSFSNLQQKTKSVMSLAAAAEAERKKQEEANKKTTGGTGSITAKVPGQKARENDAFLEEQTTLNNQIKAAQRDLLAFEENINSQFKQGQLGRLQVIEMVGAKEIEVYNKQLGVLKERLAAAQAAPNDLNKKNAVAQIRGLIEAEEDKLSKSIVKTHNQTEEQIARIDQESTQRQIHELEKRGEYVAAAMLKYSTDSSIASKSIEADLEAHSTELALWMAGLLNLSGEEVAELTRKVSALQKQSANMVSAATSAIGAAKFKESAEQFDTLFKSLEADIASVDERAAKGGGWFEKFAAQDKIDNFINVKLPELEAKLKATTDAADAKGATQQDKTRAEQELKEYNKMLNRKGNAYEDFMKDVDKIGMEGFEALFSNVEGAWSGFTKKLKNMFKTSLVDELYKMFSKAFVVPIIANILGTSVSGNATSNMAGSATNSLFGSLLGNGGSLLGNAGSSLLGALFGPSGGVGITNAATGSLGSLGLGAAEGTGLTASLLGEGAGASLMGGGASLGSLGLGAAEGTGLTASLAAGTAAETGIFGAASAAYSAASAAGAGMVSAAGSGLMAGLAAIPVYGWIAAAALAIFASADDGPEENTFFTLGNNNKAGNISINQRGNEGKKDSYIGTSSSGAFGTFGVTGTNWVDPTGLSGGNRELMAKWDTFMTGIQKSDAQIASFLTGAEKTSVTKSLDSKIIKASTGEEGADPSAAFGLVFAERMNTILEGIEPGLSKLVGGFKGSSDQLQAEVAILLSVRKNIDQTAKVFGEAVTFQDLIKDLDKFKALGETSGQVIVRLSGEFAATNELTKIFGITVKEAFGSVGIASAGARDELVKAAGGLDAFKAQTATFLNNFYTDSERNTLGVASATEQLNDVFGKLGIAIPTSTEEYRNLMASLLKSGDPAYQTVMNISGAFTAIHGTAQQAYEAEQKLIAQRADLQGQLDDLLNPRGATDRQQKSALAAITDDASRALQAEIFNQQALKKAAEDAATAAAKLSSNMQGFAEAMDKLRGGNTLSTLVHQQNADSTMGAVTNAMPWIKDLRQLITMAPDDFKKYSDANQTLIVSALNAASVIKDDLQKSLDDMAQQAGISASSISSAISDGLLGKISAADLGGQLTNTIVGGVYNALAAGVSKNITDMLMQNLVNPLLTQILDGSITAATVSATVSRASIDSMVNSATLAVKALNAIFNDPSFKAAVNALTDALKGLSGAITAPSPVYTPYVPPTPTQPVGESQSGSQTDGGFQKALEALLVETKNFMKQLGDLGKSSYEAALGKIKDAGTAKLAELSGMDQSQALATVRQAAMAAAKSQYEADITELTGNAQTGLLPDASEAMKKYAQAMAAAQTMTIDNTKVIDEWTKSQIDLLNAQTKLAADKTILGMNNQLFELQHTASENLANQRRIKMEELALQDKDLNLAAGTLEAIQEQINAQEDMAQASKDAAEASKNAAEAMVQASKDATDAMTKLVSQMDAVAALKTSIGASIQSIRQDTPGYDMQGYLASQVSQKQVNLNSALGGSIDSRIKAVGELKDAITAQYSQEKTDIANKVQAEQAAYNADVNAQNKAIQSANALSEAYRGIGEYAKTLMTGDLSPLGMRQKLVAETLQYRSVMDAAFGGDVATVGKVSTVVDQLLRGKQTTSRTSLEYALAFGPVQAELQKLSSKAMPTLEEVTASGFQMSAQLQGDINESQKKAIDELQKLSNLTETWQVELQSKMDTQAAIFNSIGLNTLQTAQALVGMDERIAAAIAKYIPATPVQDPNAGPPGIYTAPEVVPPNDVNYIRPEATQSNDDVVAAVKELNSAITTMMKDTSSSAENNKKVADLLRRVTRDGQSLLTEAA